MSDINNSNPNAEWSEIDVNNSAPAPDSFPQENGKDLWVDVPENGRAIMGAIKRFWDRINATVTAGRSGSSYTYTTSNTAYPQAYIEGETYGFKAASDSIGGDGLAINSLGAKPLFKPSTLGLRPIAAGDIRSGQFVTALYDSALNGGSGGFQVVSAISNPVATAVPAGQCRLDYDSATTLKLKPMNGNAVRVNGDVAYLPAGGISSQNTNASVNGVGGTNLAASTLYAVYLYFDGTSYVLDFWTGSGANHVSDSTLGNIGVEVRDNSGTPDSSRTFVGWIVTGSSAQFVDTANGVIGVISWFNRREKVILKQYSVDRSASAAAWTEVNSEIRLNFIAFADDPVVFSINGIIGSVSSGDIYSGVGLDSTSTPLPARTLFVGSGAISAGPSALTTAVSVTEGTTHFASHLAAVFGGSAIFAGVGTPGNPGAFCFELRVRG